MAQSPAVIHLHDPPRPRPGFAAFHAFARPAVVSAGRPSLEPIENH